MRRLSPASHDSDASKVENPNLVEKDAELFVRGEAHPSVFLYGSSKSFSDGQPLAKAPRIAPRAYVSATDHLERGTAVPAEPI